MEKVRPWCGQPSDRGRLRNRTEHFPGLESHGKQPRSWKVMENDDDVLEFFVKMH